MQSNATHCRYISPIMLFISKDDGVWRSIAYPSAACILIPASLVLMQSVYRSERMKERTTNTEGDTMKQENCS